MLRQNSADTLESINSSPRFRGPSNAASEESEISNDDFQTDIFVHVFSTLAVVFSF
jgi:hypothetical protein